MKITDIEIKDDKRVTQNEEVFAQEIKKVEDEEIKEYNETLYTSDHPSYKKNVIQSRTRWESTSTIERNVDEIDKKREIYKATTSGSDRLEKKVDQLLTSKKISSTKKKK